MDSSSDPTIDSNSGPDIQEAQEELDVQEAKEEVEEERTLKADECAKSETEQPTESSEPPEPVNNDAEAEEVENDADASKTVDAEASKKANAEGDGTGQGDSTSTVLSKDLAPHYRCQLCNIFLGSIELMQHHMNEKHPEIASKKMAFKCDKCGVLFPRLDVYHEHAKLHAEGKVVPVKDDGQPKLKAVEQKSVAGPGRHIRSVVGSCIKVVRPRSSTPTSILISTQLGTTMSIQRPEHHFELNSNNLSILIGTDGQPQLEWVLDVPPL